ncbi:DNA-directed RNA polymerase subunit beta [Vibrio sp. CAU 1672]|uniref:DNA-directed RNA polymerase subunit beta n=1 Tax=Vibrio sp. CAU 1672 TaxID=3032594 RepID=UPI0023DBD502|nr:DNA-directed RNA polymerase subunit beta [Vibrio sp. CAU 1672]MDF2154973.1 DNA-directed RNA polymerase subunit beta [Vibrio sp. CAU 1672]
MHYLPKLCPVIAITFSTTGYAQPGNQIAQYLHQQSQQRSVDDHYSHPVDQHLNLEAKRDNLHWRQDGKPDHCSYAKSQVKTTAYFDYGEARDLSDGLQHFDLAPIHTQGVKPSHRVYANNLNLLPGTQQFATPSEDSFSISLSSDCL